MRGGINCNHLKSYWSSNFFNDTMIKDPFKMITFFTHSYLKWLQTKPVSRKCVQTCLITKTKWNHAYWLLVEHKVS
jgi:hypothetical protein